MTASRKRKRVKAWLVFDRDNGDVWRERSGLPMIFSTTKGLGDELADTLSHVPCTITYTEPPKRKARR